MTKSGRKKFLRYMRHPYFGTSWKGVWFGRLLYWGFFIWFAVLGNWAAVILVVGTPLMIRYATWLEAEQDIPISEAGRLSYRARHEGVCPTCGQKVEPS